MTARVYSRADTSKGGHTPVLLERVIEFLGPQDGGTYIDGTFGAGGYSRTLLEAADCTVWAIDCDPDAVATGLDMVGDYAGRLTILHGKFGEMKTLFAEYAVNLVQGIALDLGVSSHQLDDPERGFSFRGNGPLDMRMAKTGPSAADVVNEADEAQLAHIIHRLGQERRARPIARAIAEARRRGPITGTRQLAELVHRAVRPAPADVDRIDPATRTFQALRIFVNDELGQLERGLSSAEALLAPGGTVAVVSFHSLEDRAVKNFLRARSGSGPRASRHLPPDRMEAAPATFETLTKRPVRPSPAEVARNPRARSARLRAARRTAAAARPVCGLAAGDTW